MQKLLSILLAAALLLCGCAANSPLDAFFGMPEEEAGELFLQAVNQVNDLAYYGLLDLAQNIFPDITEEELIPGNYKYFDHCTWMEISIDYNSWAEYYANFFTGQALEWVLSTKLTEIDGSTYYACRYGAECDTRLISVEKLQKNAFRATLSLDYHDGILRENTSDFQVEKTDSGYRISSMDYAPSCFEELGSLFKKAMHDINKLATDDTWATLKLFIFHDEGIEIYDHDYIKRNGFQYLRTSQPYSKLADYYGEVFTGDALEWILGSKFFDVNGRLYCCTAGGASGIGVDLISIEELGENTYQATYWLSVEQSQTYNTLFEVQQTDAGPRISSIDYCPDFFNYFPNLGKNNKYLP